ncbi:glycoside hydrolase family 16 protein, partial [Glonium stellatum]
TRTASGYCECGYSVNRTSDSSFKVFTELLETDFLHSENLTGAGWTPQEYNVSHQAARGPYGKQFRVSNVVANPLRDEYSWAGSSVNGGDAGLQLWVRSNDSDGLVGAAELAAQRTDVLYGSFRIGVKMSGVQGTCAAFFWFRNDSQEIDLEFLSKQFNDSSSAVNLVLQTPLSVAAGYDASGTPEFKVEALPFRPDKEFHEYRFDWSPEKVSFYADGRWLYDMTNYSPNSPGHLVMNHWSNGDPSWSAGPPQSDAVMTVSYVKAYFNSSNPTRKEAYAARCPTFNPNSVCEIPDQTTPPDPSGANGNQTARTFFFSLDPGYSPNQTVYKSTNNTNNGAASRLAASRPASLWASAPLFVALLTWTFAL